MRARRWWRWVAVSATSLVLLWLAAPSLLLAGYSLGLPRTVSRTMAISSAGTWASVAPTMCELRIAPARLRADLPRWGGPWLPPTLLRSGQYLAGSLRLEPQHSASVAWRAVLADEPAPRAVIRCNAATLNTVLAPYADVPVEDNEGWQFRWQVAEATVHDAGLAPDGARRLAVVARGVVSLAAGNLHLTLPVRRLEGVVLVDFTKNSTVLRQLRIRIDHVDLAIDPVTRVLLSHLDVLERIEKAANKSLARSLDGTALPPAFPVDLQVDAVISDDGSVEGAPSVVGRGVEL